MLCGVFALLIKPIDFLTFSATPSWDETAAWGRGGDWRLSGERTVKNPPVGFPGLVGRGGLDTSRQLYKLIRGYVLGTWFLSVF